MQLTGYINILIAHLKHHLAAFGFTQNLASYPAFAIDFPKLANITHDILSTKVFMIMVIPSVHQSTSPVKPSN